MSCVAPPAIGGPTTGITHNVLIGEAFTKGLLGLVCVMMLMMKPRTSHDTSYLHSSTILNVGSTHKFGEMKAPIFLCTGLGQFGIQPKELSDFLHRSSSGKPHSFSDNFWLNFSVSGIWSGRISLLHFRLISLLFKRPSTDSRRLISAEYIAV